MCPQLKADGSFLYTEIVSAPESYFSTSSYADDKVKISFKIDYGEEGAFAKALSEYKNLLKPVRLADGT